MRKTNIIPIIMALLLVGQVSMGQNKPNSSTKATKTSDLPTVTIAGTDKVNYVRSFDFFKPMTSETGLSTEIAAGNVMQATQYMDGLGRPMQTVARRALPSGYDMVQFIVYDQYGRQVYQPMAFQSEHKNGRMHLTPSARQSTFLNGHYADEDIFYGLTEYENSPLNRVTKQMAPGNSWAGDSVGVTSNWRTNTTGEGARSWIVGSGTPTSSAYGAGQLMVTVTTDEELHQVKEFTDKLGRTVLKQVQKGSSTAESHSNWLNTYYLYDDYGNLRYVLPPRLVELMQSAWTWNTTQVNNLGFQYTYDGRNRMVTKQVPGAGRVDMVYDKLDRLVLTQDANQRNANQWTFTKYDALNRPVMTGFYSSSSSRTTLQGIVNSWASDPFVQKEAPNAVNVVEGLNITISQHITGTTKYRVKAGGIITFLPGFDSGTEEFETTSALSLSHEYTFYQGYYDATFPIIDDNVEVLSLSYFDDYDFTNKSFYTSYSGFYSAGGSTNAVTPIQDTNTRGMATGSKVKVLGTEDQWLSTVMFYDDRGRVIQSRGDNHLGGEDISTSQYDFSGKVLNTHMVHTNPQAASPDNQTIVAKRYTYENSGTGRLTKVRQKLNNTGSYKVIATNTYNALGELKDKTLGTSLETLNYNYNVRGWLEGINEDYVSTGTGGHYFGMDLSYDYGFTDNQLNGNIAGVKWRSQSSSKQRAYGFEYDPVNRLTKADYSQKDVNNWVNTLSDFSTTYGYDANGNILNLMRKGVVAGTIATIDDLTYDYGSGLNAPGTGNKLNNVVDSAGDLGQGDFKDGTNNGPDYHYDVNGNLDRDKNKGINSIGGIAYNHLNLPTTVTFTGSRSINYTYDAAGIKLKKTVNNNGTVTTTDYAGGFIYENNDLQFFAHDEGRVRKSGGNFVYDYYIKDHLGNTRMTLTEARDSIIYLATMETDTTLGGVDLKAYEESLFLNLEATRDSSGVNSTGIDGIVNDEAARLNGNQPVRRIGPAKMLLVSPGDTVDIEVFARYYTAIPSSGAKGVNVLISSIAAAFGGVNGGTLEEQGLFSSFNNQKAAIVASYGTSNSTVPKAYLNYMLLDPDFKLNSLVSGFQGISGDALTDFEQLSSGELVMPVGGYLYIYTSNETNYDVDVYFDDLRITHKKGHILQEDHYYPFGLNISALSSTAPLSKPNKYKFNGNEEQTEFDLNLYDFNARFYDPILGRYIQVDPLSDHPVQLNQSPYQFSWNNPSTLNDPNGKCPSCVVGAILGAIVELGTQVTVGVISGQSFGDALGNVDWVDVGVASLEGAITSGASIGKRIAISTVTETIKASVDYSYSEGLDVIGVGDSKKSVSSVATEASFGVAFGAIGGKSGDEVVEAGSERALKSAQSEVTAKSKNLAKANNAVVSNPGSRAKSLLPRQAFSQFQDAKKALQKNKVANMFTETIGAEETKAIVDFISGLGNEGTNKVVDKKLENEKQD